MIRSYVLTANLLRLWQLRKLSLQMSCANCPAEFGEGDTVISKRTCSRYGHSARLYCPECAEKVGLL